MRKILFGAVGFAALAGAAGLALAQTNAGAPAPPLMARHDLFQGDANSDGVLTRAEFDAARAAHFAEQDANHDGQLARDEMGRGFGRHHGGRGGMHGFHGADANNDGNITREEFLARPTEHFERLDANHDGVITTAERPQHHDGAGGHGRHHPDANDDGHISRAEHDAMGAGLFERMDANNDGRVTREEADAARLRHHERD